MSAKRNDLLETIEPKTRIASTVYVANTWLKSNNAGEFIDLTPGNVVAGLLLEGIDSSDPNFAVQGIMHVDLVSDTIDRFLMDVTVGSATPAMEGLLFDVDPADAGGLSVAVYSTMNTGFLAGIFVLGETVTGGTSGATGVVIGIGSNKLVLGSVVGTFVSDETVTGGTSGATAKMLQIAVGGTQFEITHFITATLVEVGVRAL